MMILLYIYVFLFSCNFFYDNNSCDRADTDIRLIGIFGAQRCDIYVHLTGNLKILLRILRILKMF